MVLGDRDGSFEPIIVSKRKRGLDGIDQIVLSLTACGLSTGEVAARFEEVYAARVSKDTISRITEKIVGELAEWLSRPLDPVYPVIVARRDSHVKVRDGQVRNTPFYVVVGVTMNGERDILGIWAGDGAEGARFWLQIFSEVKNSFPMRVAVSRCQRFWLQIFSEVKNRGIVEVMIAVCDGLEGLPEVINTAWEHTVVQ